MLDEALVEETIDALLALLDADADLMQVLGGPHIYRSLTPREPRIPAVEITVIHAGISENFEPFITQWDMIAEDPLQLRRIEGRLRRKLHWVGWRDVGGIALSSTYEDSRDHPSPDAGRVHRSIDFRHQPVRRRG